MALTQKKSSNQEHPTNQGSDFQLTEVGWIPKDWEVVLLPEIVNYIHGKAHEPFVDDFGEFIVVNSKFISTEGKETKSCSVNLQPAKKGDVLTVLSDLPNGKALAKCFYVNKNHVFAVNQRICIWRSKSVDSKFLFYLLNRNRYFLNFNDGVSQTHILNHHIDKCPLQIPPTNAEQTAIAKALSDMDALIEAQEQLIAKKRAIKQGAMQELLTPKEGWEVKRLGEIVNIAKSGGTPTSTIKAFYNGNIPFLAISDMTEQGKYIDYTSKNISMLGIENSASWIVPLNSIIYSMYASVGLVSIAKIEMAISQAVLCIIPKNNYNIEYLFYQLSHMKQEALMYVGEGTQKNLNAKTVIGFEIYFPSLNEQTRIAKILSDMDAEIDKLENQLSKYRQLKAGMMQDLLTGRKRLNLDVVD